MNAIDNKLIPLAMVLAAMGTACIADGVDEEETDRDPLELTGTEAIDAAPAALSEMRVEARGGFIGSSTGGFSPYSGGFSPKGGFSPYLGGFSPYLSGFSPYLGGFSPCTGGAPPYYGFPGKF